MQVLSHQSSLSTGQIAKLFSVSPRTAVKWCEQGTIKSHILPSTTKTGRVSRRRVTVADAIEFAKAHQVPMDEATLPGLSALLIPTTGAYS
jgi:hypothetical protein